MTQEAGLPSGAAPARVGLVLAIRAVGDGQRDACHGRRHSRLDALRQAMAQTLRDPEFLADAKTLHIDIEPMDADETTKTANRIFETPADAVARIKSTIAR